MIQTSNSFKKAVYAPTRTTKARIRFEILDIDAFTDNAKTVTSEASISKTGQLTNKIRKMDNKYGILEKDYLKLDGSFVLPPKANEGNYELGWLSNSLCDSNGLFTPIQVIQFSFSKEHSSMGLTLYFDMLNNEYANEFDIDVYGASGNLIRHDSIVNNTLSRYIYVNQLTNYTKIVITIKKWCKGYRRAKVIEVDFGVIKEYEDDTLIKLNILQELDTTSSSLPSDELKFTVDNSTREFNMLNPTGIYGSLQQGQECFVEIGIQLSDETVEYLQVGKFYLKDWQSDEGTLTTTFTARDIIDSLSNVEVENSTVRNITLFDLATEVLGASGIDSYVLSNNLKLIYTKGLHQKMSYRNLLQLIATAGMCVVYTDNLGTAYMKQLINAKSVIESVSVTNEAGISNKDQIINTIVEPSFNVATFEKNRLKLDGSFTIASSDMSKYEVGWWSSIASNSSGTFDTPLTLTINISKDHSSTTLGILFDTLNNEYASEFDIKAYDISNNLKFTETIINTSSRFSYQNNLIENSRKIEIVIKKWSKPYMRARIVEIGFDLPLDNITFDNIYKEPQITLNQAVKAVEVTYYPTDLESKATYTAINNNVKEGSTLKLDNSLINTLNDAKNVAEWLLKEYSKTAVFKVDWRQNPALGLSDKVSLENGYGSHNIANITRQEFTYQGYLSGKTEAKGAI